MLAGKRPHLSPLDATPKFLQSLKEALKEAGVSCAVMAGYTDLPKPRGGGSRARISDRLRGVARPHRRGTRRFRRADLYRLRAETGLQAQWKRCVAALREMCDRAAAHGVTIAIQNHHDLGLHTEALLELLADIDRPNCKLGFDAWSPALRGESLYAAAKMAAPHTAITTNADYIKVPRHRYRPELVNYERQPVDWVRAVPFGTGFIDYTAFFQGLRDGGYSGWRLTRCVHRPRRRRVGEPRRVRGAVSGLDAKNKHDSLLRGGVRDGDLGVGRRFRIR